MCSDPGSFELELTFFGEQVNSYRRGLIRDWSRGMGWILLLSLKMGGAVSREGTAMKKSDGWNVPSSGVFLFFRPQQSLVGGLSPVMTGQRAPKR